MRLSHLWIGLLLVILLMGCTGQQPQIIIITATPPQAIVVSSAEQTMPTQAATGLPPAAPLLLSPIPQQPLSNPTPNAPRPALEIPDTHIVQSGDTLSGIAAQYGISLDALTDENPGINPNIISIGQEIALPDAPDRFTPDFKIIPDSRLIRAPGARQFDVATFVAAQPGYIRVATDIVDLRLDNGAIFPQQRTAAQVVEQIALEYSVDPRLLLAILEYRAGWLSQSQLTEEAIRRPLVSAALAPRSEGLYEQLAWAANELNRGYYGWKYRGLVQLQFAGDVRALFAPTLNPGTIGVQYMLALDNRPYEAWLTDVGLSGLYATYARYFGDPFSGAVEPLVPPNIQQPPLALPFEPNVEWRYTGGPHGGWGSGSAWASLDFAPSTDQPPSVACYLADDWVTAVAPGAIARVGDGVIVLDLDGDSDESTGWTINYLHVSAADWLSSGLRVNQGDLLGQPSCVGGISNGTHVHIGRRFNGEWLPADCQECLPGLNIPSFTLGNWTTVGLDGQYYQGFMLHADGRQIQADQSRAADNNRVTE